MTHLKRIMKETRGGVLVLVALILVPTILILGLAVDSAINLEQQRKLQTAVDAAARSGAINGQGSLPTITSEAQKLFTSNTIGMSGVTSPTVSYDSTTRIVSVSASITVPTMFMKVGGINAKTFNATGTYLSTKLDEVVIFVEVSDRSSTASSYNETVCNQLINFINSLPNNMLVSIVPVASEIKLDSASTVPSALFNHLSNSTDDESANPAHYPLSSSLAWNLSNFNSIDNLLYLTNATTSPSSYGGISYVGSTLSSYSNAATCPGGYATCPATLFNANCPSTSNKSCTSTYRYSIRTPYAILPLTLNRTLITSYINNLKAWKSTSKAYLPSLISWAWRAIDPAWSDFWQVNLDSISSTRITVNYPQAYDPKVSKSIVIIAYDQSDWTDYTTLAVNFYMKKCGDRVSANADGTIDRQLPVNSYGAFPVTVDDKGGVNDITCENYNYKTVDQSLGLNLTDPDNWSTGRPKSQYPDKVLTEVDAKFNRICTSIKAQGVYIYAITTANSSYFTSCATSSADVYTVSNNSTSIDNALQAIVTKIKATVS